MAKTKKQVASPLLFILTVLIALLSFTMNGFADAEKDNTAKEAYNQGIEYKKTDDKVGALTSFKLCIKEDPNYIDAYIQIGSIQFSDKNYDEALSAFKTATEKDSKSFDAFSNLGKVQYKLKKYAEAELSFKSAIALKEDAGSYKELGKVYYKKKNNAEVITTFNKSHELGGGDHLTYYMLGKAYKSTGKSVDAIKALKKSASIKPDYYLAHSTLGQIYLNKENYSKAASAFKKAMKAKSKKRYRAAYNYAIAVEYSDDKNYAVNITNWQKFIKMAKGNPNAKAEIESAQSHVKELQDAKEEAELQ